MLSQILRHSRRPSGPRVPAERPPENRPAGFGCTARPEIARRSAGRFQFTIALLGPRGFRVRSQPTYLYEYKNHPCKKIKQFCLWFRVVLLAGIRTYLTIVLH
ncbi:hypothetical protein Y032_0059g3035 [Ancylostoma ceylanicum]|uniref:Uncharacterized protein n=1 Tax=Ancylostoma ceylanicum TaxID=53326 RepID=A0A016U380_9BILA|nr:hypothetical protein Y032_0059g3035 [Ancylostoma ceylanicum]